MGFEPVYNTARLHALRRELEQLNEAAAKIGLIASQYKVRLATTPSARQERAAARFSDHKGKAAAKRLLTILAPIEGDVSPRIPGTDFTEEGVVRLLAHLRKRSVRAQRGNRFFRRLLNYLTRPVSMGKRISAGISVERLQLISRRLREIEARGWRQYRVFSAARRGRRRVPLSPKHRMADPPMTSRSPQ